MRNFKQNNRSSGRRDSRRQEMHKAVCSECGKECEVPFKPTGDKPIYCSDCFKAKRDAEPRRSGGRSSGRFDSGDRTMHEAVCDNCGKKCEVPFKPTGNKPIYCSECFGKGDKGKGSKPARPASRSEAGESKQFELINTKLDKILKALGATITTKANKEKETIVVRPKKVAKGKVKKIVAPKKKAVTKPKKATKSKAKKK